jgi:hypothetical protein
MLNKALKDNPDIRVAEAKVREAEAELNRTRLQVTQKVLAFHHSRESQKALIKVAEEDLQKIQKLEASKAVSQEEVKQAQQRLSAAKAKLAEIEGEMPYLLGQQHGAISSVSFSPDGKMTSIYVETPVKLSDVNIGEAIATFHSLRPSGMAGVMNSPTKESDAPPKESGTMPFEKIRKALHTTVTVDYQEKPVGQILKDLEKKVPDLSFHAPGVLDFPVTLKGSFPLQAVLQLIQDTCWELDTNPPTEYGFAVREYGLLFAPDNRIPPGAIRLKDLQNTEDWDLQNEEQSSNRQGAKEKAKGKEDKKKDGQKK